jgi:hypothetical protein
MWKKMGEGEEAWANKVGLITLLDIEWKELDHGSLLEFMNNFVIKRFDIYFGRKLIVYVISKLMMEELLYNHDIKPPYTNVDQWNSISAKYHLALDTQL